MKLYGSYTSPFVRHCRIALLETHYACDFIETDQAGSAAQSPTKRVPFLDDGDIFLTDSISILKHLREKAGQSYLTNARELDQFCLVNTALDTTANLFFLQRDGVDLQAYEYTRRQAARIESSLAELNQLSLPKHAPYNDVHLRLACYLAWGLFRNCINIEACENLQIFLAGMNQYQPFIDTAPLI
jgi:glutathione S-transferase